MSAKGKPEVRIDNVVCTFSLGVESISLEKLYCVCPAFEYNPAHFGAAVINVENPKCTCLVFASASGVCVGAQSQEAAHLGLTIVINTIRSYGFVDVYMRNFKVRNIVSSMNMESYINLEKMSLYLNASCSYNPSLFPGLRCKPVSGHSSSALIYSTGSIVITGCNTVSECATIAQRIYDLCSNYDNNPPPDKVEAVAPTLPGGEKKNRLSRLDNENGTMNCEREHFSCVAECKDSGRLGLSACIFNEHDAWTMDDDLNNIFSSTPSEVDIALMSAKATGIAVLKREVKKRKIAKKQQKKLG